MKKENFSDFLKGPEAANYIRVSKGQFHKLRKRDGFPEPRYVGASPVWRRDDLAAWVESQLTPRVA